MSVCCWLVRFWKRFLFQGLRNVHTTLTTVHYVSFRGNYSFSFAFVFLLVYLILYSYWLISFLVKPFSKRKGKSRSAEAYITTGDESDLFNRKTKIQMDIVVAFEFLFILLPFFVYFICTFIYLFIFLFFPFLYHKKKARDNTKKKVWQEKKENESKILKLRMKKRK